MQKILFLLSLCLLLPAPALAEPPCDQQCQQGASAPRARHVIGGREGRWLRSLPEERQAPARGILEEALPEIMRLRHALREKVDALADLNYDESTPPETLLQLGRELQETRNALRERLVRLDNDLRENVGSVPAALQRHGRRLHRLDLQEAASAVDKN